jgi:hypothetical protein
MPQRELGIKADELSPENFEEVVIELPAALHLARNAVKMSEGTGSEYKDALLAAYGRWFEADIRCLNVMENNDVKIDTQWFIETRNEADSYLSDIKRTGAFMETKTAIYVDTLLHATNFYLTRMEDGVAMDLLAEAIALAPNFGYPDELSQRNVRCLRGIYEREHPSQALFGGFDSWYKDVLATYK